MRQCSAKSLEVSLLMSLATEDTNTCIFSNVKRSSRAALNSALGGDLHSKAVCTGAGQPMLSSLSLKRLESLIPVSA